MILDRASFCFGAVPVAALLRKRPYGTRLSVAIAPAHPSACSSVRRASGAAFRTDYNTKNGAISCLYASVANGQIPVNIGVPLTVKASKLQTPSSPNLSKNRDRILPQLLVLQPQQEHITPMAQRPWPYGDLRK